MCGWTVGHKSLGDPILRAPAVLITTSYPRGHPCILGSILLDCDLHEAPKKIIFPIGFGDKVARDEGLGC